MGIRRRCAGGGGVTRAFLIGKATIGRFSDKEWASEGAYGGHVDANGWFSLGKTREWDVNGIFEE